MRIRIIKTICAREFQDLLRDRRTIISMFVVPLFFFPAMALFFTLAASVVEQRLENASEPVVIAVKVSTPGIVEALREAGLEIVSKTDPRQAVANKESVAGMEEIVEDGKAPEFLIYVNRSDSSLGLGGSRISAVLANLKSERIRQSLLAVGASESVLSPFTYREVNVATQRQMAGRVWGNMLGYLLVIMMFSGGVYPIIDMTVGERERKTLEMLLSIPASRIEILSGKLSTAAAVAFLTATLTIAGVLLSQALIPEDLRVLVSNAPLDGKAVLLVLVTLMPLSVLAASLVMAISLFAKSFREAQSYLGPLMLLMLLPLIIGNLPGSVATSNSSLIPALNASLLVQGILVGEVSTRFFMVSLVANTVYAIVAVMVAKRIFESERVLFKD